MSAAGTFPVVSCLELNLGDEIEAIHKGTVVHRGRVTELAPDHNLFWIIDDLLGGRRLLDLTELEVLRVQASTKKHTTEMAA